MSSRYQKGMRSAFQGVPREPLLKSGSPVHGDDNVGGPWVATPGYIKGEIARLQAEMVSFNDDIIKSLSGSYRLWLATLSEEELQEVTRLASAGSYPVKDFEDLKTRWGVLDQFPDSPLYNFFQFYNVAWIATYRGWLAFHDDHLGFRDWVWGNVIDSVESWRKQLQGSREQVVQFQNITLDDGTDAGMVITSADPVKGPDWIITDLFKGAGGLLKTFIIGGAIIVGGILGLQLLNRGGGRGGGRAPAELPEASKKETKAERTARIVGERIKEKTK